MSVNHVDSSKTPPTMADAKAPDPVVCEKCQQNQFMFIDRARHLEAGFQSAFFLFYVCKRCNERSWKLGNAIIIPLAYMAGLTLLLLIGSIRAMRQ